MTTTLVPLPALTAGMTFDQASAAVVDHLSAVLPMGFWGVTRCDEGRQLYLEVRDRAYGLQAGDTVALPGTFCVHLLAGSTPSIAPDAMAVPAYAAAAAAAGVEIGSYIGIPIAHADGTVFGTLCGLDPEVRSAALAEHEPLLRLLGVLLGAILDADIQRTEQARALEGVLVEADTDPLTGLWNRRGWERRLAVEEARLARFGEPVAVLIADLDGLKEVNDRYGHAAGDRYLALAGDALRAATRATDVVARLGGDEFGVLAIGAGAAECEVVVARLRAALAAAGVSASIGRATYEIAGGFAAAVAEADAAMYRDKVDRRTVGGVVALD